MPQGPGKRTKRGPLQVVGKFPSLENNDAVRRASQTQMRWREWPDSAAARRNRLVRSLDGAIGPTPAGHLSS